MYINCIFTFFLMFSGKVSSSLRMFWAKVLTRRGCVDHRSMTDHVTPAGPRGPQDKKKNIYLAFLSKKYFFCIYRSFRWEAKGNATNCGQTQQQCCGYGMFIPVPDFFFHPEFRISNPGSEKKRTGKKLSYLFAAINFTKVKSILF